MRVEKNQHAAEIFMTDNNVITVSRDIHDIENILKVAHETVMGGDG